MYQEIPKTIELVEEAPLDVEQSTLPWDGLAILLILLMAFILIGVLGAKAWEIRRILKYHKGSRRNPRRKAKMRIYFFLMISVVIVSEIAIYAIALR